MNFFPSRQAKTTLRCPKCGQPLNITRSCHDVRMECPACGKTWPLKDYISQADTAMENFLENVYCDRI